MEIIHFDLNYHDSNKRSIAAWLSSQDHDRARKFVCPISRHQYIICRAYLRALLTAKLNCHPDEIVLQATNYGKPYAFLRGQPVPFTFNVSHSGRHGVIAFSRIGDIGVDVQVHRQEIDLKQIAKSYFHHSEIKLLERCDKHETLNLFYRIWTLKESIIKAIGKGFYTNPKGFSLPENILHDSAHGSLKWIEGREMGDTCYLQLKILPFYGKAALAFAVMTESTDHRIL